MLTSSASKPAITSSLVVKPASELLGSGSAGAIGIAHVINPDWFITRSGVRKGGKLLADWNRSQFQIAGAVFAAVAAYLLYVLFRR